MRSCNKTAPSETDTQPRENTGKATKMYVGDRVWAPVLGCGEVTKINRKRVRVQFDAFDKEYDCIQAVVSTTGTPGMIVSKSVRSNARDAFATANRAALRNTSVGDVVHTPHAKCGGLCVVVGNSTRAKSRLQVWSPRDHKCYNVWACMCHRVHPLGHAARYTLAELARSYWLTTTSDVTLARMVERRLVECDARMALGDGGRKQ